MVPVYGPEDSRSVYAAEVGTLKAWLESGIPLTDCPAEACGIRSLWQTQALPPVFRPVADEAALNAAMPDARELLLRRMTGVTVVDPATTYIDPRCSIAPGVTPAAGYHPPGPYRHRLRLRDRPQRHGAGLHRGKGHHHQCLAGQ